MHALSPVRDILSGQCSTRSRLVTVVGLSQIVGSWVKQEYMTPLNMQQCWADFRKVGRFLMFFPLLWVFNICKLLAHAGLTQ